MRNEQDSVDSIREGIEKGVLLTLAEDPSTVLSFCCGTGLPITGEGDPEVELRRQHYSNCPVWQEEVHAREEHRRLDLSSERPAPAAVPGVGLEDPTDREIQAMLDQRMSEQERELVRQGVVA